MKDLTQGSIGVHLVSMAVPTAAGLLLQTLYVFVDLYFVAGLGDAAIAGVSAAANFVLVGHALVQVLGVGTVALISHAAGRKDQQDASLIFNQSLLFAAVCGVFALIAGYALTVPYLHFVVADEGTLAQARTYLYWLLPSIMLQFAMVAMSSALRGLGLVKRVLVVQVATVLLDTVLTPVLIEGWGTGYPMGVAGAALANSIAALGGVTLLWLHFNRLEEYVSFRPDQWQPQFAIWKRILVVGLPMGGELLLFCVYGAITFWAISKFGPAAQAGFGIGSRIVQGILLPAMAIAFAVPLVAGQNFGARQTDRVRQTFHVALIQSNGALAVAVLLCHWQPEAMVRFFSPAPEVVRVGTLFLQLISWSFIFEGVSLVCSGMFQALGNTLPALLSTAARLVAYVLSTVWLTAQPDYKLEHLWYLSIAALGVQAAISFALLRRQTRLCLGSVATQPA